MTKIYFQIVIYVMINLEKRFGMRQQMFFFPVIFFGLRNMVLRIRVLN